jgi:multidrug efflux system membrane fusion protein
MRIVPILNAVLVTAVLYGLVFERDRLLRFAGADPAAPAAAPTAPQAQAAGAVGVIAQRSRAQPLDMGVLLRGQTEAARRLEVRAETSGRVISAPLRRGAKIDEGTLLCEIDPGIRAASLAEAEARLLEAEINASAALSLQQSGYRSDTAAAAAQAARQGAEAGVKAAEAEIARLTIFAPFAGLLEVDAAETGSLLTPGALCATVIALDPVKLVGFVAETEVDRIAEGAMAGGRLASGGTLAGSVSFVAHSADPNTRTFRVEVTVPNPDLSVREGQTVEMLIAAPGTTAHLLPASALTLDDEGRLGLRLVIDGHAVFQPVQVLRDAPEGVWLAGLPEVADVVVVGQEYVTEATPLLVTYREAAP